MTKKRVVLVTGGMGGLGETISTKMVDAGYKVAVTYSPGNKKRDQWLAEMKARGYDFMAVECDVARRWPRCRPGLDPSMCLSTTPALRVT